VSVERLPDFEADAGRPPGRESASPRLGGYHEAAPHALPGLPLVVAYSLCGTQAARRDYNTKIMTFFGFRSFARSAPLAVVAVLLCVGVFLPWLANGPEATGSPMGLHYSQVDQGTNGGGQPPTGTYAAAFGEEAKEGDKDPVNAGLLTALLLAGFFGAIVGWLLSNYPGSGAFRSSSITRWSSFVTDRQVAPFLGVFRL
jgi:hypothetical protein